MKKESLSTTVRIMDKEYQFSCPAGEQDALVDSARYLDGKMKEIRKTGRTIGMDRIAVMAAMNITHELLEQRNNGEFSEEALAARLKELRQLVENALGESKQLEL